MKIATALVLSALLAAAAGWSPARAQSSCPIGSYPSVDSWGNQICRRAADGSAATTTAPPNQPCPTGSHPAVDSWGNQICRSYGGGNQPRTDYYDISKGCPAGAHEWVDNWGNKVCKTF